MALTTTLATRIQLAVNAVVGYPRGAKTHP